MHNVSKSRQCIRCESQIPLETNEIKASHFIHNKVTKFLFTLPCPPTPIFLTIHVRQLIPVFSMSHRPGRVPLSTSSQHWTKSSTKKLASSAITQPTTLLPPKSRITRTQPIPDLHIFNIPTAAPFFYKLMMELIIDTALKKT